jgi:hypothetical protein
MTRPQVAHVLKTAHQELTRNRTIDLELGSPEQLLQGYGEDGSGIDALVGVLDSALRLPDALVIRIALPEGGYVTAADIAVFRKHCQGKADESWREAMALRQGGIRELPRALVLSVVAATIGVVSGYVAQDTDRTLLMVLLYAVAFVSVIAAWTIGWTPIEQATFDWRAPGHTAAVYELLSEAHVDVVQRSEGSKVGS